VLDGMGKLSQSFKNLKEKWNGLSKNKKIALGVVSAGIIGFLIFLGISLGTNQYAVLFSNMNPTDAAAVYKQLQTDKVNAKVSGNSILVPKGQVDQLRMQMLSEVQMTDGSPGFELLDKTQFGATDQQINITYQRALQGELERTIKGFSQIADARVHLVIPDNTAFVKDTSPGSASVTLKLKPGEKLTTDQVRSVIALITGAVKGIPKDNVQVMDDNMNLLSRGLDNNNSSLESTTSTQKQQKLQEEYQKDMEEKLTDMLEAIYGKGKVEVKVNADLNFDAVQQESVTYDPKTVVVSEHDVKDNEPYSGNGASGSPVDNNMTNTTPTNTTNTTNNDVDIHDETTKNYDVSKVEQKVVKAPGTVKRLTASIVIDGNVNAATKTAIQNLAISAIGYDAKRGDTISVEGIPFDTTAQNNAKKDLAAMNQAAAQAQKTKLYTMIGIGAAALLGLLLLFFFLRRRKNNEEELLGEKIQSQGIDVIIGDDNNLDTTREHPKFKSIEFDQENERTHVENEIKQYAKDKPEQVADIIKSWLAEDER
jgi:flagellar M-ring protein FliF